MTRFVQMTTAIAVKPELWATSVLPEGVLERWLRPEGSPVEAGDPVATIRIEDALHELMAPARGHLYRELKADSVIEPGTVIGRVVRWINNT